MKKIIGMILALAVLLCTVPSLAEVQTGNVITFGTFEQDNDKKDGKEPIEWIVLDITENQAFVVSRYVLTARQFHNGKKNFDWSKSAIRKWLNGDFMGSFTKNEKKAIVTTIVNNDANQSEEGKADGGKETKDQVFLLSFAEVAKYFPEVKDRKAVYTDAAIKAVNDGSMSFDDLKAFFQNSYEGCYVWYLRSFKEGDFLTGNVNFPETIFEDGNTGFIGTSPILVYGIRPAMVLDLNVAQDAIQIIE